MTATFADAPPPLRAAAAPSRQYGVTYDSLWLNLNRDGRRSRQDFVHGVPKAAGPASARISVHFQSSAQARR